jgi:hypothetical protein
MVVVLLRDSDLHPDEATVRVFRTSARGVVRWNDQAVVTAARYGHGVVVLWHYAFADRWFKVNVTTDLDGHLVETGDERLRFAFNCDVATPMRRVGRRVWSVDLFLDVLVRQDTASYAVTDVDQFEAMAAAGVLSDREVSGGRAGLAELIALVEYGAPVVGPNGANNRGRFDSCRRLGTGCGPGLAVLRPQSRLGVGAARTEHRGGDAARGSHAG